MKFIVAIVQDYDVDRLLRSVTSAGLGATKISSTGGFLRAGNTTVLMGVDDHQLATCFRLIEHTCRSRSEVQFDPVATEYAEWYGAGLHEVTIGGAVVFQVNVDRFVQFSPALPQPE